MDLRILHWIESVMDSPILIEMFRFVTYLGNGGILWICFAGVLMLKKKRKEAFFLILTLVVTSLFVNVGLKHLVMRPRPFVSDPTLIPRITPPSSFSFPSGHSATSMCCALFHLKSERNRLGMIAFLLGILICLSRLVLLVHYPTDVLAGALIGMAIGWCLFQVMKKAQK